MLKPFLMFSAIGLMAISQQALAEELVGEWANDPDECDQMRVIYVDDGDHLTKIYAGDEWQIVNESEWERDGDDVFITTSGHVAAWTIEKLDNDEMHLVNQDPEAEELGVAEARFFRCDPR